MKPLIIAAESYREQVLPADVSDVQLKETRRAFYAGAQATFHGLVSMLDQTEDPTQADLTYMEDVHKELQAFVGELVADAEKSEKSGAEQ